MAEAKTAVAHKPIWLDLSSSDPAGSREFYSKLFGWDIEVNPDPQYGGDGGGGGSGKEGGGEGGGKVAGGPPPGAALLPTAPAAPPDHKNKHAPGRRKVEGQG